MAMENNVNNGQIQVQRAALWLFDLKCDTALPHRSKDHLWARLTCPSARTLIAEARVISTPKRAANTLNSLAGRQIFIWLKQL